METIKNQIKSVSSIEDLAALLNTLDAKDYDVTTIPTWGKYTGAQENIFSWDTTTETHKFLVLGDNSWEVVSGRRAGAEGY